MNLAMVGLGRMGGAMARRLLARGHGVVAYSKSGKPARELEAHDHAVAAMTLGDVVKFVSAPRVVWMMLPAGPVTEQVFEELSAQLEAGDLLIDGGNSRYEESIERGRRLESRGIRFLDCGTSGGVAGEKEGYCLMVGGSAEAVQMARPVFDDLTEPGGWAHVGPSGAGHFVKMVHNGIEYGLMQSYAEGFSLLGAKEDLSLDLTQIAEVWRHGSVVRSWLLDLAAQALSQDPTLSFASPEVADSGEGRWTVEEAVRLGVPAPVIAQSLFERFSSRDSAGAPQFARRMLSAMRHEFGGHLVAPEPEPTDSRAATPGIAPRPREP
jgi:6-phosphogluconate dehydrogenase